MDKIASLVKQAEVTGVVAALTDAGYIKIANEEEFQAIANIVSQYVPENYTMEDVLAVVGQVIDAMDQIIAEHHAQNAATGANPSAAVATPDAVPAAPAVPPAVATPVPDAVKTAAEQIPAVPVVKTAAEQALEMEKMTLEAAQKIVKAAAEAAAKAVVPTSVPAAKVEGEKNPTETPATKPSEAAPGKVEKTASENDTLAAYGALCLKVQTGQITEEQFTKEAAVLDLQSVVAPVPATTTVPTTTPVPAEKPAMTKEAALQRLGEIALLKESGQMTEESFKKEALNMAGIISGAKAVGRDLFVNAPKTLGNQVKTVAGELRNLDLTNANRMSLIKGELQRSAIPALKTVGAYGGAMVAGKKAISSLLGGNKKDQSSPATA